MDKTVCITGASQGLGFGLIQEFSRNASYQVVAITRNKEKLLKKLEGHEGSIRINVVEADVSTDSGREIISDSLLNLPPLEVLIHNAGTLLFKPFEQISETELQKVYSINVFAPFLLTQKLLPQMKNTHVIHISSVGGVEGSVKFSGLSAYSSSKSALNCLTEMLSEELKDTGIVFNCLALGSVETEMFSEAFPGFAASSTVLEMSKYIVGYAISAPSVMRGKIISLSKSNP